MAWPRDRGHKFHVPVPYVGRPAVSTLALSELLAIIPIAICLPQRISVIISPAAALISTDLRFSTIRLSFASAPRVEKKFVEGSPSSRFISNNFSILLP